ncbi:hypothetical protein BBW65_04385 [Helicobacter enhydrae]|uniref:Sialidase n=1 Tax=Helicobacter enhydrae TaxID=222136 RepID=A0A1B1U5N2_9HELI|nr:hypothetical protein [Helicobacter enhydrae]ANV98083.1 hypothetical protein BBW65_04385 [Helicobacter enhydrae]
MTEEKVSSQNKQDSKLEDTLNQLRQIGIERIGQETRMDRTKIQDILDKRFDRLDYVRARGFVHILQRQYHLDLSEWLEEYVAATKEQEPIEPSPKQETSMQKKILQWVGVALVLIGVIVIFTLTSKPSEEKTFAPDLSNLTPPATTSEEIQLEPFVEQEGQDEKNANPKPQENKKEEKKQDKQTSKTSESASELRLEPTKALSEYGELVFDIDVSLGDSVMLDSPKPMWVGIVNLKTRKRIGRIQTEFKIPISEPRLVVTSRGGFKLYWQNEIKEFKSYKPVYLIVTQEGGLREITHEEFVQINGGEW